MAFETDDRSGFEEPAIDLVSRIQTALDDLSPAERRVAEAVQSDFEAATAMSIDALAALAGVSKPTVTRFCRSVGCASYREFTMQLARTLSVASAYLRSDRVFDDDLGLLARTVTLRAMEAVRSCLDQIDIDALRTVIASCTMARRIDIYGQGGGSAAMVEDARLRLFRLGIPVQSYVDGHQQRMSAATLAPGDVVLAISNSGNSKAVVEAVQIARSFGATTCALTRARTPLAETAALTLCISIAEDDNVLLPTPSRYAHLVVIDALAAGVAMQLGARGRETLRRVRHTVARIGIAIPTPSSDLAMMVNRSGQHE